MPTFCRHNRLLQNCPICAREQHVEMRPVVSPSAPRISQPRATSGAPRADTAGRAPTRSPSGRSSGRAGVTVRKLVRGADDGYRSGLAPGLKSGADAERLAAELAFAAARLEVLAIAPPGLYAEVADSAGELEERTWLAFLIAYLGVLDGDQPFAEIERVRTAWSSDTPPALDDVRTGPRGAYEPGSAERTIAAYRAWAARAGSQAAAITGEVAWTPERRFARAFARLALPGFPRGARFELLTILGRLGVYDLHAGALGLGGSDPVTLAAKRLLGIGDTMLLERRAADLAGACGLPLDALDAGLFNWERGSGATLGMSAELEPDGAVLESIRAALSLPAD
jgi:hypothetical protein